MLYVPLLKTRQEELRAARDLNYCFSENIIPLFEIIADQYETKYLCDPITGAFLYEKKGKVNRRIVAAHTDADIITLDYISKLLDYKLAFIDYFRFTTKKYGNSINVDKIALSFKLSRDPNLYKARLMEVSKYANLIPVVSIKDGFHMAKVELNSLLTDLQNSNRSIALRITENWLADYESLLLDKLRSVDYLLFDISEQDPTTKFMELDEISEMDIKAKVILLNSPRKASIKNGDYETSGITKLISNSALIEFAKYEFDGFGDYGGLKDALPANGGSNGTGAALALLYNYSDNGFHSFLNPNTKAGVHGYNTLLPHIMALQGHLNPTETCPAFNRINDLISRNSPGNWSTWINIILIRYMHQIFINIK